MKFTPMEIIAMNQIAGYDELFGLPLHVEQYEDNVLREALTEKDIIKEDTLTDIGVMLVTLFEQYHLATTHIFMNRSRIAFDHDSMIAFIKEKDTIDLVRKNKVKVVEDIVMGNSYLQKEQQKKFIHPIPKDCSQAKWMDVEFDKFPNYIMIQKFTNNIMNHHLCLAWNDEEGCCYDYLKETIVAMGPRDLRMSLLKLFEVEVNVEHGRQYT